MNETTMEFMEFVANNKEKNFKKKCKILKKNKINQSSIDLFIIKIMKMKTKIFL